MMNGLRDRIVVQVDGQLKTGRDVVIAALMGAEEFGFATAPLVVSGCIMMRVCHLNTCPVGIATQDPELREEVHRQAGVRRELLPVHRRGSARVHGAARLPDDGRDGRAGGPAERPRRRSTTGRRRARLLGDPARARGGVRRVAPHACSAQDHGLERALDNELIAACADALEHRTPVSLESADPQRQPHRRHDARLRGHAPLGRPRPARRHDPHATSPARPARASARSCRAASRSTLEGDANDYVGKGLSGGKIVVFPPRSATFVAEENIIIGNVALYGATSGEAYIRGVAGERFAVRNSGAIAVVEGVGDHGCEYMTGGRVVVLGRTGRNFAAGMSGGIAYVLDVGRRVRRALQPRMVDLEPLDATRTSRLVLRPARAARRVAPGSDAAARVLTIGRRRARVRQGDAARLQARARRRSAARTRQLGADVRDLRRTSRSQWVRSPASSKFSGRSRRTRPVAERLHDWREVYLPYAGAGPARSGRALHGLRHSVLPSGLSARQPDSRLERSRLSRPLGRGDRAPARDEQLPRVHRAGCARRRARARACSASTTTPVTIKAIEAAIIERAFDEGWVVATAADTCAPASASPSSARGRPGWRRPSS